MIRILSTNNHNKPLRSLSAANHLTYSIMSNKNGHNININQQININQHVILQKDNRLK